MCSSASAPVPSRLRAGPLRTDIADTPTSVARIPPSGRDETVRTAQIAASAHTIAANTASRGTPLSAKKTHAACGSIGPTSSQMAHQLTNAATTAATRTSIFSARC